MPTYGYSKDDGMETRIYDQGAGGDPQAKARIEASNARRRVGSTPLQRLGGDAGYIPGYGHSAAANNRDSLMPQAQWDQQFKPQMSTGAADPYSQPAPGSTEYGIIHAGELPGTVAPHAMTVGEAMGGAHPMNNLYPGQANTASLANHVQVTPNLPINPPATGNETGDQWAAIQRGNAVAYAPGGTFQAPRADPYQTTPAGDLAAIAARYGTAGGQNGVAFVNDQRSTVDASGNPIKQAAKTLPVVPGVTPAVDANNKANPYA